MKNDPIANAYLSMFTEDVDKINSDEIIEEKKKNDLNPKSYKAAAKTKPAKGAMKPVEDKKHSDRGTVKKAKVFNGVKESASENPFDALYNKFLKEDGLTFASVHDTDKDDSFDLGDDDDVSFDDEDESDFEGDEDTDEESDDVSFTLPKEVARQLYDVLGDIVGEDSNDDELEDTSDDLEDAADELEDTSDDLEDAADDIKQESTENKPQKFNIKYKNPGTKTDKNTFKVKNGKAKITSGSKPTGGWVSHKPTAVAKLTKSGHTVSSIKTGDLFSQG